MNTIIAILTIATLVAFAAATANGTWWRLAIAIGVIDVIAVALYILSGG